MPTSVVGTVITTAICCANLPTMVASLCAVPADDRGANPPSRTRLSNHGGATLVAQETGTFRTFLRRHSELPIRNQIGSTVPRLEAGVNPAAWRRPRNGAGRPGDSRLCERTPRSSAGRPRSWLLCAAGRSPAAAPLLQVPAKWRCCAGYVEANRERMPCRQFRDMGCRWGVVESAAACAGPSTAPTPCRRAQGRPGAGSKH